MGTGEMPLGYWPLFAEGLGTMCRSGLRFCFLGDRQHYSFSAADMTDYSDSNDTPTLDDVVTHIAQALDSLDRLIASHESRTAKDQRILRRMIRQLSRPNRVPAEKRVKKLAELMRNFTFLCRLDDHRSDLESIRDDLVLLHEAQRVPASDVPHWRREFYTAMAAVLVLDREFFAENPKNDDSE